MIHMPAAQEMTIVTQLMYSKLGKFLSSCHLMVATYLMGSCSIVVNQVSQHIQLSTQKGSVRIDCSRVPEVRSSLGEFVRSAIL